MADNIIIDDPIGESQIVVRKASRWQWVFSLPTLHSALTYLGIASEAISIVITLFTSIESIGMHYLQSRRVFTLDRYRAFVAANYASWLCIYAAWAGSAVFHGAARTVAKVLHKRSWARAGKMTRNTGDNAATGATTTGVQFEVVNE